MHMHTSTFITLMSTHTHTHMHVLIYIHTLSFLQLVPLSVSLSSPTFPHLLLFFISAFTNSSKPITVKVEVFRRIGASAKLLMQSKRSPKRTNSIDSSIKSNRPCRKVLNLTTTLLSINQLDLFNGNYSSLRGYLKVDQLTHQNAF